MRRHLVILAIWPLLINATPRQDKQSDLPGLKPLLFIIERVLDNQAAAQRQQSQRLLQPSLQHEQTAKQQNNPPQKTVEIVNDPSRQQQQRVEKNLVQPGFERQVQYGGLPFYEPQFQYPGYNFAQDNQPGARVQPQIYIYDATRGQGQPILINPGNPPGNFLVPQQPQPGPNFVLRNNPPQRPVYVAGYPKPAHVPPIEKDAEEIPTNPEKIPPLANGRPAAKKPEKLETFNEGKNNYPTKSAGEADVLEAADRNPQQIPGGPLKPGQRFFILNGEPLYQNHFQFEQYPDLERFALKVSPDYPITQHVQPDPIPKQQILQPEAHKQQFQLFQGQTQPVLLQRQPAQSNINQQQPIKQNEFQGTQSLQPELNQPRIQFDALPRAQFQPFDIQRQYQAEDLAKQGVFNIPSYPFFRNAAIANGAEQNVDINQQPFNPGLPFNTGQEQLFPIGQFKFNAPNTPYFPIGGEDIENDSIVVDAKIEAEASDTRTDAIKEEIVEKSPEPGTAQASPSAIALAGLQGMAEAAPKATALVGKGGIAVSSPRATALAGTTDDDKKNKRKNKIK